MSKTAQQKLNRQNRLKEDNPFYIDAQVEPNAFGNTDWEHLLLYGKIKPIR